jgi:hypothetical protein
VYGTRPDIILARRSPCRSSRIHGLKNHPRISARDETGISANLMNAACIRRTSFFRGCVLYELDFFLYRRPFWQPRPSFSCSAVGFAENWLPLRDGDGLGISLRLNYCARACWWCQLRSAKEVSYGLRFYTPITRRHFFIENLPNGIKIFQVASQSRRMWKRIIS